MFGFGLEGFVYRCDVGELWYGFIGIFYFSLDVVFFVE